MLWVPEGFAHGFFVVSDYANVLYKNTNYWHPNDGKIIKWNDNDLNINWPLNDQEVIISAQDNKANSFNDLYDTFFA